MGRKSTPLIPLDPATSARLSRQARASTKPEVALRRELHRRGLRYRLNHPALPGRPDIALTRAKVAVFVDGCFWHRCPLHGTTPRNNRAWWDAKLDRNVIRDRAKDAALFELGWIAVHVWEHETVTAAAERVESIWRQQIMARSSGNRPAQTAQHGPGSG